MTPTETEYLLKATIVVTSACGRLCLLRAGKLPSGWRREACDWGGVLLFAGFGIAMLALGARRG
jgi:hypothetical protein